MAERKRNRTSKKPPAPARPERRVYPVQAYQAALEEEFAITQEIVAAGLDLHPRIRIIGSEEWSITLPTDQYDQGRVLLALRGFADLAMTRALVISTPELAGFDVYALTNGGVHAYSVIVTHDPMYRSVDAREHWNLDNAPKLVLSLVPLLLSRSDSLSSADVERIDQMLGPSGCFPATQINPAPHQHPPGAMQTWTH